MDYSWSFIVVAVALVLTPGADFALIVRNSMAGGRRQGVATTMGVSSAAALQGLLVSLGIASVIVRVHPVFLTIKWVGITYLAWIAWTSLRSAVRGEYSAASSRVEASAWVGFRQGFLCNATNPKILVFYLSLLPQFVDPTASVSTWLAHAWTLPIIGTLWCLLVVCLLNSLRRWLEQKPVRRTLDAVSGLVMLGFCAKLAREA